MVVFGVIAFVAWRWVDGTSIGSSGSDAVETTASATAETDPTVAPTTTVRRTTTTSSTSTTTATTTTEPARRVDIDGEVKPCRFGDACLVASFTIVGFDDQPDRYVCIYSNSRSEFGFNGDGEDDACFTADDGDTIAIEVDGVVSNTIAEDDLDGE